MKRALPLTTHTITRAAFATAAAAAVALGTVAAAPAASASPTHAAAPGTTNPSTGATVNVIPAAVHAPVVFVVFDNVGLEVGFASRKTNDSGNSRHLEVCDHVGPSLTAQINVADATGNATDRVLEYTDPIGGGCFTRDLGYPIRKFRAFLGGSWLAPPRSAEPSAAPPGGSHC